MTQILSSEKQGLIFEIRSARIVEETEETRKHVLYTVQVRFLTGNDDMSPSVIERRYTHFFNLYESLYENYPLLIQDIVFPRKVLFGNFENELISNRSMQFEGLLNYIASKSILRSSKAMQVFLQEPELSIAKEYIQEDNYKSAYEVLEKNFKLINKVCLDRSPAVILTLSKLVGVLAKLPIDENNVKWAELAIYRFNGISDSDLLEIYIPLLHTCIDIYLAANKDTGDLENQLRTFEKQGIKGSDKKNLFNAIDSVELRILN